jgi:hypothetical protein
MKKYSIMVRKSGRDDSYFASWLINAENGEIKEGTMEKLIWSFE